VNDEPLAPGLYLVATPIGNLEDITMRALRVLRSVDRIACEDTRQTRKLLDRYGITTPTISSHEHNEAQRSGQLLIQELKNGARIAVVSDAGTPGISDPGMVLRSPLQLRKGFRFIPIPGASAVLAALVASGLGTEIDSPLLDSLPPKSGARRTALGGFGCVRLTDRDDGGPSMKLRIVLLKRWPMLRRFGVPDCRVVLARELTKLHEEFLRGVQCREVRAQLAERESIRGEIVLLVDAKAVGCRLEFAAPLAQQASRQRLAELAKIGEVDGERCAQARGS
jgi:16S rRNA (cytidine1402-2'-O)-methyltransferase